LSDNSRNQQWLTYAVWIAAIGVFIYELTSLYRTPLVDSYLWWGDESWLMLEFRSQLVTGYFHHPYAFGSSLHTTSGLLFSNMWLTALIYGVPAAIFHSFDIAFVGRTVTAVLSALLLCATYVGARRVGASRAGSALAVLLVVTTRTFFLTSHSARYDILSALVIVLLFSKLAVLARRGLTVRDAFIVGLLFTGSLMVSVHVLLALAFAVPLVIVLRSDHRGKSVAAFAVAALVPLILFVIVAFLSGSHSLFGYSGQSGYYSQIANVPALRPFSRSVQLANLHQRLDMALKLAGPLTLLVGCGLALAMIPGLRRRRSLKLWWLPLATLVAWLLFESSAPTSYLVYIVPVIAVSIVVLLSSLPTSIIAAIALVLTVTAPIMLHNAEVLGTELMTNNTSAVEGAVNYIRSHPQPGPVLTINLAVHVLERERVPIMTTQFIEFPATTATPDSVLRQNNVHYMLLYQSALHPDYMREILPLTAIARTRGTLVYGSVAPLTDIARDYFHSGSRITSRATPDTLQLYMLHD
jgi:hypothetical protein